MLLAVGCVVAVVLAAVLFHFAFSGLRHFEDCAFYMLLIWSVVWLGPTVVIAFFIFKLLQYDHAFLAQAVCLIAVAVNLVLIFSVCPMDLWSKPNESDFNQVGLQAESTAAKFLIEENRKAVDEIKARDEEEDTWFHNKFILVGGLLAATLGYIGFGPKSEQSAEEKLSSLSTSPSTALLLGLASILALGIDMHVRGNACEVSQLGLWIRYYVEPVLLHRDSDGNVSASLPKAFLGWEEFLRRDVPKSDFKPVRWDSDESKGIGKHSGELWNFFYEPHTHFLTGLIYLLYLTLFQSFALRPRVNTASDQTRMQVMCFAVVQASFFAFAWIAHSAPEMFDFKVLPFVPAHEAGFIAPLHYFVPCLALIVLNAPYIAYYYRVMPRPNNYRPANAAPT